MLDLALRKAQELAFALIKVAGYIRRTELRHRIEKFAYHLIETVSVKDTAAALEAVAALRNFVLLGKNLYEIETNNARILDREMEALEIELTRHAPAAEPIDVSSYFSVKLPVRSKEKNKPEKVQLHPTKAPEEIVIDEAEIGSEEITPGIDTVVDNRASDAAHLHEGSGEAREDKILAMITATESGKLQLRDFIAAFPDVSERTIRYDLKHLADSGKIERQGSGGPSNFYVRKE